MNTDRARAVAVRLRLMIGWETTKEAADTIDAMVQEVERLRRIETMHEALAEAHSNVLKEVDNIKQVEFPRRLGNVTKPLIAERDALRAEVERLRGALDSVATMSEEQSIARYARRAVQEIQK